MQDTESRLLRFFTGDNMATSFNNLWDSFIDFENIYYAFLQAKKGKRYRWEALQFSNFRKNDEK